MNNEELITLIEAEWDLDNGFFGKLRQGQFDWECYLRCRDILDRIRCEAGQGENISRRLVSLVWYIPLFMGWQTERVKGSVDDQEYQKAANEFQTKIQEILGVP
ncbi:MAG TPA: hypothetical protein VMF08_20110 [Candidatus Sulfotelmatobacter sp.]|nr:hypothetical protein [Candidatus Sulfotelmatobacter sp.]